MTTATGGNKRFNPIWLVLAIVCLLWLMFLTSCTKTIYQPVPEYHEVHDTVVKKEIVEKEVIKEVMVRDSVSFQVKGDTVKIERWHYERDYRTEKKLQAKIDSLTKIKRDSIPYAVEVPVEVKVPRDYTFKDKVLFKFAGFGIFCLALIILYIVYRVAKNKITRH